MKYGFDLENDEQGNLFSIQIYDPTSNTADVYHIPSKFKYEVDKEMAVDGGESFDMKDLLDLIENNQFVGHNLYYDDQMIFANFGMHLDIVGDSFIQALMTDQKQISLKELAKNELEVESWGTWDQFKWEAEKISAPQIHYGACDAKYAFLLERYFQEKYEKTLQFAYKLELRLIKVLNEMCYLGARVDNEVFESNFKALESELEGMQKKLFEMAGREIKINSSKDVAVYLFEERGLKPTLRTPKGAPSTSKEALEFLRPDPFVELLIELKHYDNVFRTMGTIEKYLDENNIIHPNYKPLSIHGLSGRIYSENPSINQWPWELREAIVPEEGNKFFYLDIKAAEVALSCFIAEEEELMQVYREGGDIYAYIAKKLLQKDEVSEKEREKIKIFVLSTIYGSEGSAVARALNTTDEKAKILISRFRENFKIEESRQKYIERLKSTGYATTLINRRKRVWEVFSKTPKEVEKGLRRGWNFQTQTGLADFVKCSLVRFHERLKVGRIVTTVFDSILFEVPEDHDMETFRTFCSEQLTFKVKNRELKFEFDLIESKKWIKS